MIYLFPFLSKLSAHEKVSIMKNFVRVDHCLELQRYKINLHHKINYLLSNNVERIILPFIESKFYSFLRRCLRILPKCKQRDRKLQSMRIFLFQESDIILLFIIRFHWVVKR